MTRYRRFVISLPLPYRKFTASHIEKDIRADADEIISDYADIDADYYYIYITPQA